jgi:hypothetical protein
VTIRREQRTWPYDLSYRDQTLFQRADMVETAWSVIDPISDVWKVLPGRFPNYAAGTWGPNAADELLRRDGREWRRIAVDSPKTNRSDDSSLETPLEQVA